MGEASKLREFWNGRRFRLSAGGGLLLMGLFLAGPRLFSYSGADAVVNGRLATLQTPIEGLVAAGALRPGQQVTAEQVVAEIKNARINESFLGELRTERESLRRRIAALDEQLAGLEQLRADLDTRRAAYRLATQQSLDKEIEERQAARAARAAQLDERTANLKRQEALAGDKFASRQTLEQARADQQRLVHELAELDRAVERLRLQREQVAADVYVGNGRNDVPYTEQRRDEVDIQRLDIIARRGEYATRVAEIDRQVAAERGRLDEAGRAALRAPFAGVVWRTAAPAGANVVIGSEVAQLLDCSTVFLDVLLSETRYDDIRVGDEVKYRLLGSGDYKVGKVAALRGSGLVSLDTTLAATVQGSDKSQFRVWVSLDPADVLAAKNNFCQVGRRAEVRFAQRWSVFKPAMAAANDP